MYRLSRSSSWLINATILQILDSWRTKRIIEPTLVDEILHSLENREESMHLTAATSSHPNRDTTDFPKDEVLRRFEEDRERVRPNRFYCPDK